MSHKEYKSCQYCITIIIQVLIASIFKFSEENGAHTTKQKKKLIFATWVAVSFPTVFNIDSCSLIVGYDIRDNFASNAWLDGSCRISIILLNLTRGFLGA